MFGIIVLVLSISTFSHAQDCKPSITTVGGSFAPTKVCAQQLILEENFDTLNKQFWAPETTLDGRGNNEFEWYVYDDENSYAKDGKLYITPTLTVDKFDSYTLEHGCCYAESNTCTIDVNATNCDKKAGGDTIINPVRSARLNTENSFTFTYGRVEFVAKNPKGDWMWPALWLMPAEDKYGNYTGEIDVMESRGNQKYVNYVEATLQFGELYTYNESTHEIQSFGRALEKGGYDEDFHKYELIWDQSGIEFLLDGEPLGSVPVQDGYWQQTQNTGNDPWANGAKTAPFDQKFYLLINLAIGGTSGYFPDNDGTNKPWSNESPKTAEKDFWTGRQQWLPSWADKLKSSFVVDSVKVYAI